MGRSISTLASVVLAACVMLLPSAAAAMPRCEGKLLWSQIGQRQEVTLALLRAREFDRLQQHMDDFLAAYVSGKLTDEELFYEFGAFDRWGPFLTPIIEEWVARHPRSFAAHHAMALHQASVAWQARGGHFARDTSSKQMDEFVRRMRQARDWSLRSLDLQPKPILAYQQLMAQAKAIPFDVALPGQAEPGVWRKLVSALTEPRPDVLPILQASLRVQPDNTIVRVAYIGLLSPRWGGSLEALERYARPATHPGLPADRMATVMYESYMEIASHHRQIERRPEDAVPVYQLASRVCRLNQPLIEIGHIRLEQARHREALDAAEAAVALAPDGAWGRRLKALALRGLGRHEEAAALMQRLLPDASADIVYLLGEYHASGTGGMKRDPVEARRLFGIAASGGEERAVQRLKDSLDRP